MVNITIPKAEKTKAPVWGNVLSNKMIMFQHSDMLEDGKYIWTRYISYNLTEREMKLQKPQRSKIEQVELTPEDVFELFQRSIVTNESVTTLVIDPEKSKRRDQLLKEHRKSTYSYRSPNTN